MFQPASQLALSTPEVANCYLMEVCTQVLQGPQFSSDLDSSCFFRTAATKMIQQEHCKFRCVMFILMVWLLRSLSVMLILRKYDNYTKRPQESYCSIPYAYFVPYAYGTYHMRIRVRYNHTRVVRKIVPSEYS